MKIISEYPELKGQIFDSVEACAAEEKKIEAARENKKTEEMQYKTAIESARAALAEARKELTAARKEAQAIAEEANKKIDGILSGKKANVIAAEKNLRKALAEYNAKYVTKCCDGNHNSCKCREAQQDEDFVRVINMLFPGMIGT